MQHAIAYCTCAKLLGGVVSNSTLHMRLTRKVLLLMAQQGIVIFLKTVT